MRYFIARKKTTETHFQLSLELECYCFISPKKIKFVHKILAGAVGSPKCKHWNTGVRITGSQNQMLINKVKHKNPNP